MKFHLFLKKVFFIVASSIFIGCVNVRNIDPSPIVSPPLVSSEVVGSPFPTPTDTLLLPATTQPVLSGRIAILNVSRKYTKIALLDLQTSKIQNIQNPELDRAFDAFSWSPDGKWIVVGGLFPEFQNSHLLLMSPDGDSINLSSYPQGANPDWSPNGKQIIYNSTKGFAIFDITGERTFQLTYPTGLAYYPAWSPDGTSVAYVYNQNTSSSEMFDKKWELWIVNSNGKDARPVISDFPIVRSPLDWSPDSKYITFISLDGKASNMCGDIYIVKSDGTDLTRLTSLDECATNVSWSTNGKKIAFIGRNKNVDKDIMKSGWQIYVMDSDGKNITQVTDESEWVLYGLAWKP
ncbi:MAG: DPP IV N-terminal domain-containing protein [Anaerolineales bacterium]